MQWVTREVMFLFLKFKTRVETLEDRVHGIEVMSGTARRDHPPDLRVTWALQDIDTFGSWGQLHPKKPRCPDDT